MAHINFSYKKIIYFSIVLIVIVVSMVSSKIKNVASVKINGQNSRVKKFDSSISRKKISADSVSLIVVDKKNLNLKLVNKHGDTLKKFPIAVGANFGNKMRKGDLKTPEGTFPVVRVENSSSWKYDFENDNKGPIAGAYGPWFIRLNAKPHIGIGIHGTQSTSHRY